MQSGRVCRHTWVALSGAHRGALPGCTTCMPGCRFSCEGIALTWLLGGRHWEMSLFLSQL